VLLYMLPCDEDEYVDMAAADVARLPMADASTDRGLRSNEVVGCGLIIVVVG